MINDGVGLPASDAASHGDMGTGMHDSSNCWVHAGLACLHGAGRAWHSIIQEVLAKGLVGIQYDSVGLMRQPLKPVVSTHSRAMGQHAAQQQEICSNKLNSALGPACLITLMSMLSQPDSRPCAVM
jgi:hypothetical protein